MKYVFVAACALALAQTADAKTFTYAFTASGPVEVRSEATISSMADDVLAAYSGGATMTGEITFDDTLISSGVDFDTYAPISISIDGLDTSSILPGLETRVRNDGTLDFIGTLSSVTSTTPMDAIDIIWRDTDATALTAGAPFANLDISDFETALLLFYNPQVNPSDPNDRFSRERTDMTITSLTYVAPVPLPAGAPLLAAGLGLLIAFRRRK